MRKMTNRPAAAKARALPHLSNTAELAPRAIESLQDHETYADMIVEGIDLSSSRASGVRLECALLSYVKLAESKLANVRIVDSRFEHCDLANADWRGAVFERVEFVECRGIGLKAADTRMRDVLFADCNLSLVQFPMAATRSIVFEHCLLRGADLFGSNLEGARVMGCDLRDAELTNSKLRGADFRGSQIEAMRVEAKDVYGLVVDFAQAAQLAHLLGLVVE